MRPLKHFHLCVDLAFEIINSIEVGELNGIPLQEFNGDSLLPHIKDKKPFTSEEKEAIGYDLVMLQVKHPDCVLFNLAHTIDHIISNHGG